MRRSPSLAVVSTILIVAAPLGAQTPLKTLAKADVEYSEPFTTITGVRELRDGRIIVADAREKTVQLIDLKAGRATKLGREGSGPGEYALPMRLLGLPGDTSAVYDPLNRRYLLIGPDGKVGAFASYEPAENTSGRIRITIPRAIDDRGRLYSVGPSFNVNPTGPSSSADSAPILRLDRATKKTDTVAFIHTPAATITTSGGGNGQNVSVRAGGGNPFAATDDWAVLPDGRVAVLRVKDYHVDWYLPNGQKASGPAIAYEKIKVTDEDKKQYRERAASGAAGTAIVMSQRVGPGGTSSSASVGAPTNIQLPEPTDWPDVKPPFTSNAAVGAPNGQLWVLRTRSAKDKIPTYDVFDASGKVVSRVALPANTRLLGFGIGTVYLARSDEDDLQYLQRYRLP